MAQNVLAFPTSTLSVEEALRLEALDRLDILDTPREPAFERLAGLIERVFDVPVAIVSLMDAHRQWYKAYTGLANDEAARSDTFCKHVVVSGEPMVVEDAITDGVPRFVGRSGNTPPTTRPVRVAHCRIADATPTMMFAREEIFGPVAPVFRFETEEQVIAMANATEFGLACYFYTKDLARAFRVSEALEYGIVGINEGVVTTEVAPFGGVKESGIGREGSRYGIEDYLELKYTCIGGL